MEHVLFFSLLLLFSTGLCAGNGADDISTGTRLVCQPDTCSVISELAAMREKMESMSQAQRSLTDSLKDTVQQLTTVQAKLQASSELVQDLKRDVQDLKTENQGLKTEVQGLKTEVQGLKTENQAQDEQLKSLKDLVATGHATVAFSATLGKSVGPFGQNMPVKYPRVLSNVGSGYNPATGSFTAPVRGVYYFIYSMFNNNSGQTNSVMDLMKNDGILASTWDTAAGDYNDSATNMVVVQLEAGDSVYVRLRANRQIYDDSGNYNSFAGFLLFTV